MELIMKVMRVIEKLKINSDNGRIAISAGSGYGKTYLSMVLLKKGLKAGYKVYALSYTQHSEKRYWDNLKKYGDIVIYEAGFESLELNDLIVFFNKIFEDKQGKKIIYINDLDLYLEKADSTTIALLKKIFSSIRKLNSILIYEVKDIKGPNYLSLIYNTKILFLGKSGRDEDTLFKHIDFEDLNYYYNELKDHEFLAIDIDNKKVAFVKVIDDDIFKIPKKINIENIDDEDESY